MDTLVQKMAAAINVYEAVIYGSSTFGQMTLISTSHVE
jgi:hypothetical protein